MKIYMEPEIKITELRVKDIMGDSNQLPFQPFNNNPFANDDNDELM